MDGTGGFRDHGIPVPADEARTAAVIVGGTGADGPVRFVIAARGYVVVLDPETGAHRQVFFPNGLVDYPYASIGAGGRFYTGARDHLLAVDPVRGEWVADVCPLPGEEAVGFSFAEAPDGTLYFASYPHCHLFAFDPKTGTARDLGVLDTEKYPGHLAADDAGWVYAGVGTERRNLIAFRPATGEKRVLAAEAERTRGTGYVHRGRDGRVYGHWRTLPGKPNEADWVRLHGGAATPVPARDVSPSVYAGSGFGRVHGAFPDGRTVASFSLPDREVVLRGKDGATRRFAFDYRSEGATLAPLTAGPDGDLYGGSGHPLHFFSYRPREDRLVRFGGSVIEKGGGGNIAAYAAQGPIVVGVAYAGGFLHLFDTRLPVSADPERRNPRLMSQTEWVHRPRCAAALPDGRQVVYGGFPGYGMVGGGLGFYDVEEHEGMVLPDTAVVPDQSTISLAVLPGGDIVGGTSVETPGGATPRAKEACVYRMDGKARKVLWSAVPVPGARAIHHVALDAAGRRLHGITSAAEYFVFDLEARRTVHREDLSPHGSVVRGGLVLPSGPDGRVYLLLSKTLLRLDLSRSAAAVLAKPPQPVTIGGALLGDRLFYGSGSHLWSYDLSQKTSSASKESPL